MTDGIVRRFLFSIIMLLLALSMTAADTSKALVLQDMTWVDVKEYLKTNDMIIIPMGSTEQHGPHLPLGTDSYEALEMSKKISEKTGVVVAQVLWIGYSKYHAGFPGTLSLKPETMEQVLFETVEMLMQYGFRKFMFFNYHGGNNLIQDNVIQRVNHQTKAIAVAIGIGNSIHPPEDWGETGDSFDWHAGKYETSLMLFLKPELVRLQLAEKPVMNLSPKIKEVEELAKETPTLAHAAQKLYFVPTETGKNGASHNLSSNGIFSSFDPKTTATKEIGKEEVDKAVATVAAFIETWKKAKK